MTDLTDRLKVGVDRFAARWRSMTRALDLAVEHSRLGAFSDRSRAAIECSWLFRWLTEEPDPDVVVIDLTETWTIGPILAALEWTIVRLGEPLRRSGILSATGNAVRMVERNAVPVGSGVSLGFVLGTLVLTYDSASPLWLAALAIAGIAFVLGVSVDRSQTALAGSTIRRWLAALIAPPEADSRSDGTR